MLMLMLENPPCAGKAGAEHPRTDLNQCAWVFHGTEKRHESGLSLPIVLSVLLRPWHLFHLVSATSMSPST